MHPKRQPSEIAGTMGVFYPSYERTDNTATTSVNPVRPSFQLLRSYSTGQLPNSARLGLTTPHGAAATKAATPRLLQCSHGHSLAQAAHNRVFFHACNAAVTCSGDLPQQYQVALLLSPAHCCSSLWPLLTSLSWKVFTARSSNDLLAAIQFNLTTWKEYWWRLSQLFHPIFQIMVIWA